MGSILSAFYFGHAILQMGTSLSTAHYWNGKLLILFGFTWEKFAQESYFRPWYMALKSVVNMLEKLLALICRAKQFDHAVFID
jgi:hypothetical protein